MVSPELLKALSAIMTDGERIDWVRYPGRRPRMLAELRRRLRDALVPVPVAAESRRTPPAVKDLAVDGGDFPPAIKSACAQAGWQAGRATKSVFEAMMEARPPQGVPQYSAPADAIKAAPGGRLWGLLVRFDSPDTSRHRDVFLRSDIQVE